MSRLKVYVYSVGQIPTVDLVDKEGARHACAQAGSTPFEGLAHYPGEADRGVLPVEDRNAIIAVESFCRKNNHEFEVVDFTDLSFLSKLRLRRKGVKSFPAVACGEKCLYGVPTEPELRELTGT